MQKARKKNLSPFTIAEIEENGTYQIGEFKAKNLPIWQDLLLRVD